MASLQHQTDSNAKTELAPGAVAQKPRGELAPSAGSAVEMTNACQLSSFAPCSVHFDHLRLPGKAPTSLSFSDGLAEGRAAARYGAFRHSPRHPPPQISPPSLCD